MKSIKLKIKSKENNVLESVATTTPLSAFVKLSINFFFKKKDTSISLSNPLFLTSFQFHLQVRPSRYTQPQHVAFLPLLPLETPQLWFCHRSQTIMYSCCRCPDRQRERERERGKGGKLLTQARVIRIQN